MPDDRGTHDTSGTVQAPALETKGASMRTRTVWIALLAATFVAGACGRLNEGAGDGGSGGGIDHPTGSDELVLRIEHVGGFVPVEFTLRSVPSVSLMGDGTLIVEGPMIEIYPSPALPNLQQTRIAQDGVQAILEEARKAGLLGEDATYDYPCVADAATTTFTIVAEGRTHTVSAYALDPGFEAGCAGVDTEARAALFDFEMKVGGLHEWLPEGSVGREEPFTASEMRVYVSRYRGQPDLPQTAVEWPLSEPLSAFGEPVANVEGTRCGVVAGEDLATLLVEAGSTNQLTPWTSDGDQFALIFRPMLPDEHTC
jgi:hypothetical protein